MLVQWTSKMYPFQISTNIFGYRYALTTIFATKFVFLVTQMHNTTQTWGKTRAQLVSLRCTIAGESRGSVGRIGTSDSLDQKEKDMKSEKVRTKETREPSLLKWWIVTPTKHFAPPLFENSGSAPVKINTTFHWSGRDKILLTKCYNLLKFKNWICF